MSDTFEEFMTAMDEQAPPAHSNKQFQQELYKKWFRSKTQAGFLGIKPWFEALKARIDVGKASPDGKLLSSTAVFVDIVDLAAYVRAVNSGMATTIYPANEKNGVPTNEGFVSYGGSIKDGKAVSRIFKSHYWQTDGQYDPNFFVWKCGHFEATHTASGAFIPNMSKALSVDSIKVSRQDLASIGYLLDVAMISYVANNTDWYEVQ